MYNLDIIHDTPGDWIESGEITINKRRMSFEIQMDASNYKDTEIGIQLTDMVGNRLYSDHDYHITFDPTPDHDLVIGQEVHFSPDPVIVNQVIHFRSTIINKGSMDENDILIEVMRDGGLISRINLPFLAAGSTREIRWQWKAVEGLSMFKLIIDPYKTIDDLCPQNNERSFEISSDYLDVFVNDDSIIFSDEEAENMDLISISFSIRSIGSIESGPIKLILRQDDKFLGLYQISSIFEEGSIRLTVDWKIDSSVHVFSIEVDPYNEVLESVEDNNVVYFENPFYFEPLEDEKENAENDIEDADINDPIMPTIKTEKDQDQGGTIWSGPVIGNDDGETEPVTYEETLPVPVPPPQEDEKYDLPLLLIPTIGTIIGTASVGITITAIRNEILRFKLIGLLIPLYSKLKKNKIEKGVRYEILGYLKAKPGANYSELKRNLDLNDGSLVHHLRILEREERIFSKKMGKYKLFYISSYKRESSIQDYISPLQIRILDIINREPGMVPKKLSRILDRSQTDMSYHLSELSRNGLLEKRKKGRNIHYYVNEEFIGVLS
jgi:predicted transcriptional regulator